MIEQSESSDPEATSESSSFWSGPSTAAAAAEEGRIRFIAFSHFLLQATRPDRSCCGVKLVPRMVATTTTTKTSGHISRNELFYDRKVNVARMLSRRFNQLKGLCVGGLF